MSDIWTTGTDQLPNPYLVSKGYLPAAPKEQKTENPGVDYTQKRLDLASQANSLEEQEIAKIKQMQERSLALGTQHRAVPREPNLQNIPAAPKQDFTDPMRAFQNPAVVIATLGSLFSRAPMTAALNAGAAAMEAYHKGEVERFSLKREEWKEAVEAAKSQNEIELARYNAAWKRSDAAVKDRMAELQALAAGVKDEVLLAGLKTGQIERVDKILETRQKADDQIKQALFKYELQERERQMNLAPDKMAMQKFMTEHPDASAEAMAKFVQGMKATSVNTVALQKYLNEHPDATPEQIQAFNQSGRSAGRSAISMYMNRYLQENPNATAEDVKKAAQTFSTQMVAQNRFLSGPQGNTIRSLNVVVSHLDTLRSLTDDLKNGDIRAFNQVAQRWSEETGLPAPTNFDTAKQIIGAEIIKALGVAGAGTEAERREAADAFQRARSPQQIIGAIHVVQALLGGQLKGLRRQFVASTGLAEERFDDMLEPHTRQFLGSDKFKGNPTLDEWLAAARKVNPGVSDEDLTAAYQRKYGGQ